MSLLYPLAYPWLARRYATGLDERRGLYVPSRFDGPTRPLWVHAVSVGEVQSAWPLLRALKARAPSARAVLSTTTVTGQTMARQLTAPYADDILYYPWDVPKIVRRALSAVRPAAYAALETEVWPAMLRELAARDIPTFLVNGRFSERAVRNFRRHPAFWRSLYGLFTRLLVRSPSDREALRAIAIPEERIVVTGDCKVDALVLRREGADLARARAIVGEGGPVFLAGSTHGGEDEVVLEAYRTVRASLPAARLVVVPRHPERAQDVLTLAERVAPSRRLSDPDDGWAILVVDRIGILFDLYAVADGVFVGGSLVPKGGQNIMEPAVFGQPLCHGPFMTDFPDAARDLGALGVATEVRSAAEVAGHWLRSLDAEARDTAARAAAAYFARNGGAAEASLDVIFEEMGL